MQLATQHIVARQDCYLSVTARIPAQEKPCCDRPFPLPSPHRTAHSVGPTSYSRTTPSCSITWEISSTGMCSAVHLFFSLHPKWVDTFATETSFTYSTLACASPKGLVFSGQVLVIGRCKKSKQSIPYRRRRHSPPSSSSSSYRHLAALVRFRWLHWLTKQQAKQAKQ